VVEAAPNVHTNTQFNWLIVKFFVLKWSVLPRVRAFYWVVGGRLEARSKTQCCSGNVWNRYREIKL